MNNKSMLALLIAIMALPRIEVVAAEPLSPRALARIGDHRFYHGPGITCAVLSPDAHHIASAAGDLTGVRNSGIVLWNAATGERLRELRVAEASILRLAFSPNSKRLAATYVIPGKYGIAVFDVETGKRLQQFGSFEDVAYLQFSADGKQLRVSESYGSVSSWDAATGKQLRLWKSPSLPPHERRERRTALGVLSPDGRVIVWEIRRFVGGLDPWEPDGLHVRNANTDKLLYRKKIESPNVRFLEPIVFCADGKCFATGYGDKLTIWETVTGKELVAFGVPRLRHFALAPDGRRAAIFEDHARLRLWDLEIGKSSLDLYSSSVPRIQNPLPSLQVFSADGKTLLLATDSTLRLFDTRTGKERVVSGHRSPVTPRFSADGRTLFTSCDERRCIWDVSSANKPALLAQEPRKSWDNPYLDHSLDDRLFLDRAEGRFQLRETASGRVLREWETDKRFPVSGHLSPDATRVLLCDAIRDGHPDVFRLHVAETGKSTGAIKPMDRVGEPVFSLNGRLVAWADRAGAVHLHDAVTGKAIRTIRSSRPLPQSELEVAHLFFSTDGDYLFEQRFASPMRVFEISRGREIGRFYANPEKRSEGRWPSWAACSPDNRLLAVTEVSCGIVRLLEIASGKVRAEFAGHRHGVYGLTFAPDGKTLASGGEDNVVFLWDVTGVKSPVAVKKTPAEWWNDLASDAVKRAGDAIAGLLREPEASAAFLRQRLHPAEVPDEKRLTWLLTDLDSDAFENRETASRELAQLGELAEAALRQALKNHPSLEMRRRLEDLLSKLERWQLPPETLRILRAIEILEHLGTPEARRCLDTLAKGAPRARPTREAKRALDRLAKRR